MNSLFNVSFHTISAKLSALFLQSPATPAGSEFAVDVID
jgi:hypothetical protein